MKKSVLFHLVWAVVAFGSFYAGAKWHSARQSGNDGSAGAVARVAAVPDVPAAPVKADDARNSVRASLVSRDDSVIEFLRRYGIGNGNPVSAETMQQAVSEALRETDPVKSQLLFSRLMQELTAENAPAALATIRENVGGFDAGRYLGLLAYAWGAADPVAAMTELSKNTGDRFGGRFGQASVLTGWATKDPAGAMAWLDKQEDEGKEWLTQSLVTGLARSDIDAALKYAATLTDEGDKARSASAIAREYLRANGIENAGTWLNNLSDPNMKRGAFDALAQQYLRTDPTRAAEFVKQYANEEFARGAIGDLAENLSREDPKKGLEFAASLNGPSQARAYGEAIGEWLNRDRGSESMQASEFVTRMPAGPNRDAGAEAIARSIVREDPAAAIAWATSIQDPNGRQEALVDVGRRYMRIDPQNASAWLQQSGLSPEAQQQVLAREEEGRRGDFRRGGGDRGPRGDFGRRGPR